MAIKEKFLDLIREISGKNRKEEATSKIDQMMEKLPSHLSFMAGGGLTSISEFLQIEDDLKCLAGETKIAVIHPKMLGGDIEWIPIKQLAETRGPDEFFFVLSRGISTGETVIAKAFHPRKTKEGAEVFAVTLSKPIPSMASFGGKKTMTIRATANHPFLLEDGKTYKRVDALVAGDMVMAFNDLNNDDKGVATIESIVPAGNEDVYDLTVPGYENFVAEGVFVHNSRFMDYEDMDDLPELCLSGNTLILCSQGYVRIKDLAKAGKDVKVIAFDVEGNKFVCADGCSPRLTGKKWVTVEVVMDGGGSVVATPNHKFMLTDGSYVMAKDLKPGDSLRACYTAIGEHTGYLEIYQPYLKRNKKRKVWQPFHRMVGEAKCGGSIPPEHDVHHIDENILNNDWDNLAVLPKSEHISIHGGDALRRSGVAGSWVDADERKMELSRRKLKSPGEAACYYKKYTVSQDKGTMPSWWRKKIAEGRTIPVDREVFLATVRVSPTLRVVADKMGIGWNTARRRADQFGINLVTELGSAGANHTVLCVRPAGKEDVYDLTTPKYHNFVANGIVVHNSSALDIYSDDSTQANTMTNKSIWVEGENQGLVDDMEEMLHKRINIDEEIWGLSRNLNKYGGDFEELLVKEGEGVVGLNFLPTPLVRAVVDRTWRVIGYKYHPQGKFTQTTEEDFKSLIAGTRQSAIGEVLFEDWNVAHFKLGSRKRYDIYGSCLVGNSRVWGRGRMEDIKNVGKGMAVVSYEDSEVVSGSVVKQVSNGIKKVYQMTLTHREIDATANHPFLVYPRIKGKGRKFIYANSPSWKSLEEIKVGDKVVISTQLQHQSSSLKDRFMCFVAGTNTEFFKLASSAIDKLPSWVWALPENKKEQLLQVFINTKSWKATIYGRLHYGIAGSENLIRDIKTLIDGLGYQCDNVKFQEPITGAFPVNGYYYLLFSKYKFNQPFDVSIVQSIKYLNEQEVFDIQVDNDAHNFVANGIVVHNSVMEAARWIWRRLILLEDSMLVYRLCLRGDSKIWTTSGYKPIKNIIPGDEIYSYGQDGVLQKTKVVYQKHNGKDDIYRVWSKHREIHANKTHPVLVETWTKPGSGRGHSRMRVLKYVEVQNLVPGEHRFLMPVKPRIDGEDILLKLPEISCKAKIEKDKLKHIGRTMTYHDIAKKCGVHCYRARDFFAGKYELPLATAVKVVEMNGGSPDILESRQDWGGIKNINIPQYVTEDFAQWFGFMLGDGFLCERHHKGGYVADNGVGFALGDDKPTNQCYRKLFENIVGSVTLGGDSGGRLGFYGVYSKKFVEFMKLNGFIPGAHNKRVPEWVFQAKPEIQLAFLNGLIDADGCRRDDRVDLKMCNRELLEDVRVLCMQLGITVGKKVGMGTSEPHKLPGGRIIKGGTFYTLYLTFEPEEPSEFILGVESAGNDDIYDIGVESELHNFVADGVVVHNTRAAARFIFYIDVGDRPPQDAYNYVTKVKNDFKKKRFVNRSGHLDMRWNPLPLKDLTPIRLLDGRVITLKQLAKEYDAGKENYVYSIDRENGMAIAPGKVVWCGKTRDNAECVRVTFDDGGYVEAAPDHPFMLRDGNYLNAVDLKPNDSLMPLYRRIADRSTRRVVKGYEEVYSPKTESFEPTHQLIARTGREIPKGNIIHHKDFNKLNNRPDNFDVSMNFLEHARYHGSHYLKTLGRPDVREKSRMSPLRIERSRAARVARNKTTAARKLLAKTMVETRRNDPGFKQRAFLAQDAVRDKTIASLTLKLDGQFVSYLKQVVQECGFTANEEKLTKWLNGNQDFTAHLRELNPEFKNGFNDKIAKNKLRYLVARSGYDGLEDFKETCFLDKLAKQNIPDRISYTKLAENMGVNRKYISRLLARRENEYAGRLNHKVAKVEFVENADMYCMTVEKYHNFAACAFKADGSVNSDSGVFVKNSSDEDMFIATRGGKRSAEIETLQGPVYGAIDDVEYFKDKLYAAIKIPKAYLGFESDISAKALLCLRSDTKIPLMDGRTLTLLELSEEYKSGEKFWVYSSDPKGNVIPGLAHCPRMTRPNTEMIEVGIDNGEKIIATPDHPFMLRDGSFVEAQELQAGTLLMPHLSVERKVVGWKKLDERYDGWDMMVEKHENFATAAGVFIHNSQEDIRFSRTVLRIQREIRNGVKQICKVHLAAKGIDPFDVDYDVMMTVPSAIFEQSYLETLKVRAEVADKLQSFITMPWILKNIFHFSEAEVFEMEQMKNKVDQTSGPTMDLSRVPAGAGIEVPIPDGADINQQILLAIKNSGVSPKQFLSDRIGLGVAQDKLDKALARSYGEKGNSDKLLDKMNAMEKGQGGMSKKLKELASLLGELKHAMHKSSKSA